MGISAQADSSIDAKSEELRKQDREILRLEKEDHWIREEQKTTVANLDHLKQNLSQLDHQVFQTEQQIASTNHKLLTLDTEKKQVFLQLAQQMRKEYIRSHRVWMKNWKTVAHQFSERIQDIQTRKKYLQKYKQIQEVQSQEQNTLKSYRLKLVKERGQGDRVYQSLHAALLRQQQSQSAIQGRLNRLEKANQSIQQELAQCITEDRQKAWSAEDREYQATFSVPTGSMQWPVAGGVLTSGFGYRQDPLQGKALFHQGLDIAAPLDTPIHAIMAGRVIEARPSSGYGYIVVIENGDLQILFAHMYAQTVRVKVGDVVAAGQVIAGVGSNGRSTGPHVHVEFHQRGQLVNPLAYLKRSH